MSPFGSFDRIPDASSEPLTDEEYSLLDELYEDGVLLFGSLRHSAARQQGVSGPVQVSFARAWAYDLYLAGLLVLTFLADQVTKTLVRDNVALGGSIPSEGFLRITHTYNTGSAFGLFPDQTFILMIASMVGIGILVVFFRNQQVPPFWLRTSLGLQLGGAAGNLADRITLGHVTDFLDVGAWPVFNLADSAILTGIAVLSWFMLRAPSGGKGNAKEKRRAPSVPVSAGESRRPSQEAE